MAEASDPRYTYPKVPGAPLKVENLDAMIVKIILEDSATMWGRIVLAVKLVILAAYFFARDKLIEQERLVARQEAEQAGHQADQGVVGGIMPRPI